FPTAHLFLNSAMGTTNGQDYPLGTFKTTNTNAIGLTARAKNIAGGGGYTNVALGWSYDVDGTIGAGGQIWLANDEVRFRSATAPNVKVSSSGLTVGSSGTAMSKIILGSASWTPGAITSGSQATTNITTTGATSSCHCFI